MFHATALTVRFVVLLVLVFCVASILMPHDAFADGGNQPDPPIQNPVSSSTSGGNGLTALAVPLLTVLILLP